VKVQQIKQAVELGGLEDWGTAALPGQPGVRVSGKQYVIAGSEAVDTGVFECSPGTYRRVVQQAEVMHLLSGSGSFTPGRRKRRPLSWRRHAVFRGQYRRLVASR
jgi:uncharacterized cupin superfamily protein